MTARLGVRGWLRAAWQAHHLPLWLALKVAASGYFAERGWRWWPWRKGAGWEA